MSRLLVLSLGFVAVACDDGVWALQFDDSFSGPDLNLSNWNVAENVTRTSEWEMYTAANVYVEDGNLVIRTQAAQVQHGSTTYNFSSVSCQVEGSAL